LMLCCGCTIKRMEDTLHVGKTTIEGQITELMKIFNSRCRTELIKTVYILDIFTKKELCFYDDGNYCATMPKWTETQRRINKNREQLAVSS